MSTDLEKMTQEAADTLAKAVEQYADACSKGGKDKPRGKLHRLKLEASIIHNDLVRLSCDMIAYQGKGYAALLVMAHTLHRMFEAKMWYLGKGNSALRVLAKEFHKEDQVSAELKTLNNTRITWVEQYKDYRDTFGGHYGDEMPEKLIEFGQLDGNKVEGEMLTFVKYGKDWLLMLKRFSGNFHKI